MELLERNIVVLFDNTLTKEFMRVSSELNAHIPSAIVLNTTNMLPHMTLYTTNFPAQNEAEVIKELEKISQKTKRFSVTCDTAVIDMLGIWLNAAITRPLQQLHEQIVDAVNPLREGLYDEKELVAIGDNKKRQESLVAYGMWAAKDLYVPHITLSRPIDSTRLKEGLGLLPKKIYYEARVQEIALVERGPYGTCKKILKKFPLVA